MKSKLTKIILGGLSSLLICGTPMSYASLPESKFKLPEHAERSQERHEFSLAGSRNKEKRAEIEAALEKIGNFVGVRTDYVRFFAMD